MLIIFDLDDTLIDTSGCITYHTLEKALLAMSQEGLTLSDFSEALALLRRLDASASSGKSALSEFLEILGADDRYFEIGSKEIPGKSGIDFSVFPLDGAIELLADLGEHHQLALVTCGEPAWQMEKLKKAGIDSRIFSKIAVVEDRDKKPHYQKIVDELGYPPSQVLVCGDRIPVDLSPARELGFKTVQMRWGRGLNGVNSQGNVDYTITEISGLKNIVNRLHAALIEPGGALT